MNKPFRFKKFTIKQDQSAMKIGTDGVLLGAWVNLDTCPMSILDIGAGTGVLSLMLAQRTTADIIDAIEIDAKAFEQCVENFEVSPWADRLFCYHASLLEFHHEMDEETYDLIISNPPFYLEDMTSGDEARDLARQNSSLPFEQLIRASSQLLSESGVFALIVPIQNEELILKEAKKNGLYPKRITHVKGTKSAEVKRSLMEFHFLDQLVLKDELVIEHARHQFTEEYIKLTKDFYLKM